MKITILNGNPDPGSLDFEAYLARLAAKLNKTHQVDVLELRDMDISYCVGCWGCWVKTPGECVHKDDSATVCRKVIQSDLTILASPVSMGFVTSLLKKTMDKMIPLVHPYLVVDRGEMHHLKRYENYPLLGLLLQPGPDTRDRDPEIIGAILERTALNLKTRLVFNKVMLKSVEEVIREIDNL